MSPQSLTSSRCGALRGDVQPPGDKSISHRSIMFGGIAEGTTVVRGLLEGEDVMATVAALRAMGADIVKSEDDVWHVTGVGARGLRTPGRVLDVGNSGTSARLLMGLVAGAGIEAVFDGDASLRKRPMGRVIEPLSQMGAVFESRDGKMPVTIKGAVKSTAITYELPVASAQVKSAVLLAGLGTEGVTNVIEKVPTRDHSENMLRGFGAKLHVEKRADGAEVISLTGRPRLIAQEIDVPCDPSSAAFPLVAALLCPGSDILLRNVGINPRRAGLIEILIQMGGDIVLENRRMQGGEPVADLRVKASALHGATVPKEHAPSMIDEYPILFAAASCAQGATRMFGLHELRVKESDRLALMAEGLMACGVELDIQGDDLIIQGNGVPPQGGAIVRTMLDHRIAMSFLVLGSVTAQPVGIDDGRCIATSFPDFVGMMNKLGAKII